MIFSMKLNEIEKIILILIIILAGFLRLVSLTKVPSSFHHDELLSIYEAYSIFKTGSDQWGNFLPLRFKAFGDWPPPLYFYFNVPFVLIFGLEEITVRLPSAFLGILTVFLTYLLAKEIFKNKTIAILASFFLSISPWHLQYSRLAWPAIMVPFLISLGLWLFFSGLNNQKNSRIYFAIFFISLSAWVYTPAQVFVPLFLFGLFIFYHKKVEKKVIFYSFIISLIVLFPLYFLSLIIHPEWQTRYNQISIFSLNQTGSVKLALFLYNYLSHISPYFLFIYGDSNLRHNPLGIGQLHFFEMFLLFFLIIYIITPQIFRKQKFSHLPFLFYWFFIFPLPSSLTIENIPHATRTIVALPLVHLFSSLGLYLIVSNLKNFKFLYPFTLMIIVIIIGLSFSLYLLNYYKFYPIYSASWFGYGNKEVVEYIKENLNNYERFVFSGTRYHPYLYFVFYFKIDPKVFQKTVKTDKDFEEKYKVVIVKSFNNFEFKESLKEEKFLPKTLYIEKRYLETEIETEKQNLGETLLEEIPLEIKRIIYLPNGLEAYRIYEFKK